MTYVETSGRGSIVYDIGTGPASRWSPQSANMTFAPRFSPDGRWILFSMAVNGNTDIYRVPVAGGTPQRLTNAPGIDIGGSYSPDGSRIVFESDRGGSQQLYVMNADGIEPAPDQLRRRRLCDAGMEPARRPHRLHQDRRLPDRRDGARRRRRADPDRRRQAEGPSWAPNGRAVMFTRGASAGPALVCRRRQRARPGACRPRSAARTRPGRRCAIEFHERRRM